MKTSANNMTSILLDAGTNEVEMIEFTIGKSYYGINVAKVREIISVPDAIAESPDMHPSIEGVISIRGRIIPVINLAKHLNYTVENDKKKERIIVSEFNEITIGFRVSSVNKIHRLSWEQIEPPSKIMQSECNYTVAIAKLNNLIFFILDFEKIAGDINPQVGMNGKSSVIIDTVSELGFDRKTKTILVVDDSDFIRNMLTEQLEQAGYNIKTATNGKEAWDSLIEATESKDFQGIENHIQLIITDIEMPHMDGLHLIERIRSNAKLRKLPCIVFSSMISEELSLKCKKVGSDAEVTKPQLPRLVQLVDNKIL
ncbi:chemotaxis protein CheV [bacterium]|nr:chemotaxis protein CheV [bacterium]MCP5462205.1 chemotaxis protein CheV [bacterium]